MEDMTHKYQMNWSRRHSEVTTRSLRYKPKKRC